MIEPIADRFYKLLIGGDTQTTDNSALADLKTAIEAYGKEPPAGLYGKGLGSRERLYRYATALATAFVWKQAEEKFGHTMRDEKMTRQDGRNRVIQQGQSMTYHVMPHPSGKYSHEFRLWRGPDGEVYPIHPKMPDKVQHPQLKMGPSNTEWSLHSGFRSFTEYMQEMTGINPKPVPDDQPERQPAYGETGAGMLDSMMKALSDVELRDVLRYITKRYPYALSVSARKLLMKYPLQQEMTGMPPEALPGNQPVQPSRRDLYFSLSTTVRSMHHELQRELFHYMAQKYPHATRGFYTRQYLKANGCNPCLP